MNKLVSIIIPCYNSEIFLSETLESLVNQDYSNLEVVLVDDGSTDGSVKVAKGFSEKLNLIIVTQKNSGVSAARNNGFLHSKGEFVIFLDSDDVLQNRFISSKVSLLADNNFNSAGSKIFNFHSLEDQLTEIPNTVSAYADVRGSLLNYKPHFSSVPSSYMFRSSLFEKSENRPFNIKLMSTADRYLLIEYSDRLIVALDEAENSGLLYRIRHDSMSNVYDKKLIDDNALYYKELIDNKLIKGNEIKKGYVLLLKSYIKISRFLTSGSYLMKIMRHRLTSLRPKKDK